MVAGCSYPESAPEMDDYDYRARYPLSVESEVIAVTFRGGAGGLMTEQERYALNLIVADYKDRGQAPLTVVLGGSGLNNETLAEDIRSTAVDNGLAKSEVRVGVDPTLAADNVMISFVSHTAVVPECGYWYRESYTEWENANSVNFGCSSQHNLGLMLADPSDLTQPSELDPRDGQRTAVVIDLYRAGEITGAEWNESDTTISGVGE
ncbi:MAG: CpaD family pilus assembly lipoprotein [Rhodospirillaceae bacterium]|nr:CpaD family pilus assembly lipoprotein [Rhodospirillaceae bacterium]MBT6204147.1 CpaD family pilus assembly lipoprotein [Rhodospirillaceae bacterium]MBT6511754.1 CpaD family pilus assembly lipoprotein [Rhodospirillaceae bacterium]MBT7612157.1 CpaD family pilus assembly lipoprotein [Rhodospirillaceae bacterium]